MVFALQRHIFQGLLRVCFRAPIALTLIVSLGGFCARCGNTALGRGRSSTS
jgi:hypothetical protein